MKQERPGELSPNDLIKRFLDKEASRQKLICELSEQGWVNGSVFDYSIEKSGDIQIKTKEGMLTNSLLPKGYQYCFEENASWLQYDITNAIYLDPRIESNNPLGLIALAHEHGHIIQNLNSPKKLKQNKEKAKIFHKKSYEFLISTLNLLPNDKERINALTTGYNLFMEYEAGASDCGIKVAEQIGLNVDQYVFQAINESLTFYFGNIMPVIRNAIKETTQLKAEDIVGDIYMVDSAQGLKNKSVISSLAMIKDVSVGKISEFAAKPKIQNA